MLRPAGRTASRRHHRLPHSPRRQDAGSRGHDDRFVPVAAAGRDRRLRRVAASGAERPAATRSRGSPAPSSPSCAARTPTSSGCRWRSCSPTCRRWRRCRATRRRLRQPAASRRAVTRAQEIARRPGAGAASASRRPSGGRAGPPAPSACSRSARRCRADDVRAALAAGQRAFGESYAQELRDKRLRASPARSGAARVALHRPAAEQQGQVRRRPASRWFTQPIRRRCSTPSRRAASPRPAWCRSTSPAKPRNAAVAPPLFRRCSIASPPLDMCAARA